MIVTCRFQFEAGHRLPRYQGRCRHPHGHSYKLHVSVRSPVDPDSGMAIDFHELERIVRDRLNADLDHRDLNEFLENPTAENIVVWIWERLRQPLPGLYEVRLQETEDFSVTYRGEQGR